MSWNILHVRAHKCSLILLLLLLPLLLLLHSVHGLLHWSLTGRREARAHAILHAVHRSLLSHAHWPSPSCKPLLRLLRLLRLLDSPLPRGRELGQSALYRILVCSLLYNVNGGHRDIHRTDLIRTLRERFDLDLQALIGNLHYVVVDEKPKHGHAAKNASESQVVRRVVDT